MQSKQNVSKRIFCGSNRGNVKKCTLNIATVQINIILNIEGEEGIVSNCDM